MLDLNKVLHPLGLALIISGDMLQTSKGEEQLIVIPRCDFYEIQQRSTYQAIPKGMARAS